ncbi:hypothetical protein [Neobacillus cucumis]|uniref:hypothetical protein n=1 Tax=Neobacillus cucumis TaxID=1740721 RepID=UPI001EF7CC1F|nr:hypothetical protein [Neobacillus cucumis]MBM7656222.1 hypothetical protein [Neobacillus cucumis]
MRFDLRFFADVIATVDLKLNGGDKPYVINSIEGFNKQFSPSQEGYITKDELEKWLKWRVFPETRVNCKELLQLLGLNSYNRWAIVRKTHGVMADDEIWIRTLRPYLYYPVEGKLEDENER